MKNLKILLLLFFFPLFGFSQELNGIWTGSLSNDSLTIRKDQTFEIALTEYRGKVYGYAYSTFIVNDTLFYIIKRVKGNVNGEVCEIKDDEVVTHNFRRSPDKGVNVIYTFRHNQQEKIWMIDGNWRTYATKEYYAITGDVNVKEEKDLSRSKLFEHLGDLNLQNTLSIDKPKEAKPEKRAPKEKPVKEDVAKTKVKLAEKKAERDIAKQKVKKDISEEEKKPITQKPATNIAKTGAKKPDTINVVVKAAQKPIENKSVAGNANTEVKKPNAKSDMVNVEVKKPEARSDVVIAEQKPTDNKPVTDIAKSEMKKPEEKSADSDFVFTELKKAERKLKLATAMVEERVTVPSETIYFKSDSLVLALYDNGEIDGDTVSVILNGELIIEKQLLKSAAFKKTIYLAPDDTDSLLLVLYAENLGIYPPNTGLLIVKDGEESYYVRFKADYERNAAILFRRKLK